jgi:glycine oxidase
MLAPVAEAQPGEAPLLRLGIQGAEAYPEFISQLEERTGLDAGYLDCGTLIIARDRDEAEALDRELEIRQGFGLEVTRLRPSQARTLEPALAPALRGALELPHDHVVDPRKLTTALAEAVRRSGGTVRPGAEVAGILSASDSVQGVVLANTAKLHAPQVVVAAGVWSGALDGIPDGWRPPLRPVKGQIARLRDPAGPGLLRRVVRMPPAYLAPRGDGRYVLGATMEERGFDTTVTAGAMFELLRDAAEVLPGISELVIDEFSAGLRPGTSDNAPVIGPGEPSGLYWATGHFRNGVLLAPVTATLIEAAVIGDGTDQIPAAFLPARFANQGSEALAR